MKRTEGEDISLPSVLCDIESWNMIGIVLASHGEMAKGMLDSCRLFAGENIQQIAAICLEADESTDDFDGRIAHAAKIVDSGDGVVILCDLLFGTPCNRSAYLMSPRVKVLCGMNMPLLLELIGKRAAEENGKPVDLSKMDVNGLIHTGAEGICDLAEKLK